MKDKKSRSVAYQLILDQHGKTAYYLDHDEIHFYSMDGEPVAFVDKEAVYKFTGRHLGWFEEGWLRDPEGRCVGFVEEAKGPGPSKPRRGSHLPDPAEKKEPPEHAEIKEKPKRPIKISAWSKQTPAEFFNGK